MVIFLFLFFCLEPLTELYSFWYGLKDLFTLPKLADKTWWEGLNGVVAFTVIG